MVFTTNHFKRSGDAYGSGHELKNKGKNVQDKVRAGRPRAVVERNTKEKDMTSKKMKDKRGWRISTVSTEDLWKFALVLLTWL